MKLTKLEVINMCLLCKVLTNVEMLKLIKNQKVDKRQFFENVLLNKFKMLQAVIMNPFSKVKLMFLS
ncbi:CLUMA_CG007424, isoform A [Clunio marinus]|uniref:CLUMA_CG007424, isoform A n=1 Tax=Clunio marinus TaxID=568069 RepID=A0A1J1I674_9DIPT|nr:CLUMA_CG007424, isoform A [Clunio marinus]